MLKWKQGEYRGLQELPDGEKDGLLPIFLMPPPGSFDHEDGKVLSPDEHIKSFGARIAGAWPGRLCFIEAEQVDTLDYEEASDGDHPLITLIERSRLYSPRAVCAPSIGVGRRPEYQSATARVLRKHPELPCCVRLRPEELEGDDVERQVDSLLASIGVPPERIVLALDAAKLDIDDPEIFCKLMVNLINGLPYLHRWKLLIAVFCPLPMEFNAPANETTRFPRVDWDVYKLLMAEKKHGGLLRLPIYSDHGTENPAFLPAAPVRPATQLRYTGEAELSIFKGENTRTAGYEGIYPVAQRVIADKSFAGGNFSAGDLAIETLATRPKGPGNASSWKKYGVIHHLTLVLAQLRELAGLASQREDLRQVADVPAREFELDFEGER
jgi:hypothetical protein